MSMLLPQVDRRLPLQALAFTDPFAALDALVASAGAVRCTDRECMRFALGGGTCAVCAASGDDQDRWRRELHVAWARPFHGEVPLQATPDSIEAFRKRIAAGLTAIGDTVDALGRLGRPVWTAAGRALTAPRKSSDLALHGRLGSLLLGHRPDDEDRPGEGDRLAAEILELALIAVMTELPAPEPSERAALVACANVILTVQWETAASLCTGAWADGNLVLAPFVGWANAHLHHP